MTATQEETVVSFRNVGMHYGDGPEVLKDLNFELGRGAFRFLTGRSGAGKSSLLKLIFMAERPSSGHILLFGRDAASLPRNERPALRRRIGIVFQDFRLLDHLTAMENVALPLRLAGAKQSQIESHVGELLRWVGLAEKVDHLPPTMSGGEQQRIAIARAVINRPRLLLADEPTGNVDDQNAARLLHLFRELNKIGTTVIIATHNEALVDQFDYPELRLDKGALVTIPRSPPAGA